MKHFILHPPVSKPGDEPDKHALVQVQEQYNITEGGEFLDDALRMKEQPLTYSESTEESIAAGSPENLL